MGVNWNTQNTELKGFRIYGGFVFDVLVALQLSRSTFTPGRSLGFGVGVWGFEIEWFRAVGCFQGGVGLE